MNQVYFYEIRKRLEAIDKVISLNPFMNQVYFYMEHNSS